MFRHLRTKLTVLYVALFGFTLITFASITYAAVADNTKRIVNNELQANGQVFARLWQMRANQLHDNADVLARDFGFRSAVASGDQATIVSALDNLRRRLGIDRAFLVTLDGAVVGMDAPLDAQTSAALWSTLDGEPDATGVMLIDGTPMQAVAAPVKAPDAIGWVVFGAALNDAQMRSFEALAPIRLHAETLTRNTNGALIASDPVTQSDRSAFTQLLRLPPQQPHTLALPGGESVAVALPLHSIIDGTGQPQTSLILSYPLARAFAPYQLLLWLVAGVGLLGLALVAFGSWVLARSLTKPISVLDDAVHKLEGGEDVKIEIHSNDELARLAQSFNAMASGIKERERRIRHMALYDPESALPNRRAFENAVAKQRAGGREVIVAAIGINRFDHVRDAIGYGAAGELVRALGDRLTTAYGRGRVGRLSTDKLGLMLAAQSDASALAQASKIQTEIESPLRVGAYAVDIMTTFGLCQPSATIDAAAQVTNASIAIGQAQRAHSKATVFDAAAYGDPGRNLALISELNAAMRSGDAWLVHQAKYDLRQRRVTGVEALMRWRHPTRGMISPDLFITMAEETGHVRPLTEWVLQRAIEDQAAMRAAGADLKVSVNISGRLLGDASFADRAIQTIQRARASICFEVTETAFIDNAQQALATIAYCEKAGVEVSIDDYGAGLSSLSYLKQIPAQELKIDKSFVLSLGKTGRDALLIKSTIDLAHSLGMKVTAEGVETAEVLATLAGMGCDRAQGYLIGRPLPLAELLPTLIVTPKSSEPDAHRQVR